MASWGLQITGGWNDGAWIEVSHVEPESPAAAAGVEEGDSLVSVGDKLVLFMSKEEVESVMEEEEEDSIIIQVERGEIQPMQNEEIAPSRPKANLQDGMTIVINKNKG